MRTCLDVLQRLLCAALHPSCVICRQMLEYTDSAVTRNASEKKINSLLDHISASSDLDLLQVRAWGEEG